MSFASVLSYPPHCGRADPVSLSPARGPPRSGPGAARRRAHLAAEDVGLVDGAVLGVAALERGQGERLAAPALVEHPEAQGVPFF